MQSVPDRAIVNIRSTKRYSQIPELNDEFWQRLKTNKIFAGFKQKLSFVT